MELLEAVAVANKIDLAKDEQCPFCHEKPIGHATDKPEEVDDKVTSVPKDLQCDTSSWRAGSAEKRTEGDLPYTLAKHHLCHAVLRQDKAACPYG